MGALDSLVRRWIRAAHVPTEDLMPGEGVSPREQVEMTIAAVNYEQARARDEAQREKERPVSIDEVVERR